MALVGFVPAGKNVYSRRRVWSESVSFEREREREREPSLCVISERGSTEKVRVREADHSYESGVRMNRRRVLQQP